MWTGRWWISKGSKRWRHPWGSPAVADVGRLRALERDNVALKRRVGDLMLDQRRLKEERGKQW
jgi:hypothetical protein